MPFRCRQPLHLAPCSFVYTLEDRTLESGEVIEEQVDLGSKVLPKPELFELGNQLKAGVQLDEVNPAILSAKNVDVGKVIKRVTRKSTKTKSESTGETGEDL